MNGTKAIKRTSLREDSVVFTNTLPRGDMNYFWFNAFLTKKENRPYISLGINGRFTSVIGRYDQEISIEEAQDIVSFLTKKIEEFKQSTNNI